MSFLIITKGVERNNISQIPQSVETLLVQSKIMRQRIDRVTFKVFDQKFQNQELVHLSTEGQFFGTAIVFWKESDQPVKESVVVGINPFDKTYYVFSGNNQTNIDPLSPAFEEKLEKKLQEAIQYPCSYLTYDYFQKNEADEHLSTIRGKNFSLILDKDLSGE